MKAVICPQYGDPNVLELVELPKPEPRSNEVCIRIYATAVTNSDLFIRSSKVGFPTIIPFRIMMGIRKPRKYIMGLVFSGIVESVGKKIKRFKAGDSVYGLTGFNLGAYAEYVCIKESDSKNGCLSSKPNNVTHEEATMLAYGGLLAFQFLEKGVIQKEQKVLIYGASGTTGIVAVQLAKYWGAHVDAVCSTSNMELVKSLGASEVWDYTTQKSIPKGVKYDLILDAVGRRKTSKLKKSSRKTLMANGKYLSIDDELLVLDSQRLNKIKQFVEDGYIKSVLDKCYSLADIVDAHTYVEKGHKIGGVAITVFQ